jgi:hypothetical protein
LATLLALLCLCFGLSSAPASAATRTWTGTSDSLWSKAANWQGNVAPVAGDSLVFPQTGTTNVHPINDFPSGVAFNSITIGGLNYTFEGNSFALGAGGLVITNTSGSGKAITFNLPFTLAGTRHINASGNAATGSTNIHFNHTISGAGGLVFDGAAPVIFHLAGNNTFAGGVQSSSAWIVVEANTGLGTGTYTGDSSSVLELVGRTIANNLFLVGTTNSGYGALRVSGSTPSTVNGNITIGAATTNFYISAPALTINGSLTGSDKVNFMPAGANFANVTVTLNGDSPNYSGELAQSAGSIWINGEFPGASMLLNFATRIGGTGRVGGQVEIYSGTTLAPGSSSTGGILSTGQLFMVNGSTFETRLSSNVVGFYGRAAVTGPVSLSNAPNGASTLNAIVDYGPVVGQQFRIIDNDGVDAISGTFAGLPQGAQFSVSGITFSISYTGGEGNDVVLTVMSVPPPQTLNVAVTGSGNGSVSGLPWPIQCPPTCVTTQPHHTTVDLVASAQVGSTFTGWLGGGCTGSGTSCAVTLDTAQNVVATFALNTQAPLTINIDASSAATRYHAATDGIMIGRFLFGYRGSAIYNNALGGAPARPVGAIEQYLVDIRPKLDVDGDGVASAVTDGMIILRYLLGVTGTALTNGSTAPDATRDAAAIESYIASTLAP